ncbi:MAG: polysaccharide biosynthesis/export family protein [Nitrospirota bacterium]|nr:polysaccharide biosynthesis/export family protein [Nitrospirota bacterium]
MNLRTMFGAKTGYVLLITALLGSVVGCSTPSREMVEEAANTKKEFLVGPEDVLDIVVWKNDDLSQKAVVVRPDGKISMPLIGEVNAGGLTANELASQIALRLKEFKERPAVTVSVKEVNSYYFYILGEVGKPGKYQLKSHATVLQAVAVANGFTVYAAKNRMQVIRTVQTEDGKSREIRIPARYDDMISGLGEIGNFVLKSGDVVVVP